MDCSDDGRVPGGAVTAALLAQAPTPQERVAAFKDSMAKNAAALHTYSSDRDD